ncbi:hypothetical protein GCM10027563_09580 [Parasphingorhabdus pacifica]
MIVAAFVPPGVRADRSLGGRGRADSVSSNRQDSRAGVPRAAVSPGGYAKHHHTVGFDLDAGGRDEPRQARFRTQSGRLQLLQQLQRAFLWLLQQLLTKGDYSAGVTATGSPSRRR